METVKEPSFKSKKLVDVRNAAQAASDYFRELYPAAISFSLEEVELSDDGNYWQITLSFEISDELAVPGASGMPFSFLPPKTKYKVFKVDARNGKVVSMKIRKLE